MSFLRKTKQEPMMGSLLKKLHRLCNACTKCERNPTPLGGAGIPQKSGENDRCIGAKMVCCRWQMRSWIYCKLLALSAIFCETIQPVTPSNNKVRNFWVAMTPYFFSQGINYRTVAIPFGVAVWRCAVSFTKQQKPMLITWPQNAPNSLKVMPNISTPWRLSKPNIFPMDDFPVIGYPCYVQRTLGSRAGKHC